MALLLIPKGDVWIQILKNSKGVVNRAGCASLLSAKVRFSSELWAKVFLDCILYVLLNIIFQGDCYNVKHLFIVGKFIWILEVWCLNLCTGGIPQPGWQ